MNGSDSHAVLFVDDEEKSRKYFALGVQAVFPVLTAESVDQAIEILQREGGRIGVLVTDQRMPRKNGVEILRYSRENHPAIVRLLTTAYSDLEDAVSAVNSGEIVRYIRKPWQLEGLIQDIRQAMGYFQLGLERDRLLREKLALRRVDVLVQQVEDLVALAATAWDTRLPLTAVKAFLEDAIANRWLLPQDPQDRHQFEEWGWVGDGLRRSLDLVERLEWLRRPCGGFEATVDGRELAALLMARGSWRDDGTVVSARGAVVVDSVMMKGLVSALFDADILPLPWLGGMLLCSVEPLTSDDGMMITIRQAAPSATVGYLDFYAALPLFALYLVAFHHGGRCSVDHAGAAIWLELPGEPRGTAAEDIGIEWLEDLLGELVLVAGEEA